MALPLSIASGLFIGISASGRGARDAMIEPALDLMQTIPTFAYLIPILVLFGIGPVVGMMASAIYAIPPMVRNVMLGLERVPPEIVESGLMSGSNRQPAAVVGADPLGLPTILIGVNQTMMAGLSMVVIAAMVGGVDDIGLEVFNTMKQAKFGESLLAGLVIALLAMIMDRISRGFAERQQGGEARPGRRAAGACRIRDRGDPRHRAGRTAVPTLRTYPEAWVFYPAAAMNGALEWFTRIAFPVTSAMKAWTVYYLMLPLKIGLADSVRPSFWGFEMSLTVRLLYGMLIAGLCALAALAWGWRGALGTAIVAMFYYFGTTGMPWPAFMLVAAMLAYQAGGWRAACCPRGASVHPADGHVGGGHGLGAAHRGGRAAVVSARCQPRRLGGLERPRVWPAPADLRHAADHADLRLPDPGDHGLPGRRVHRADRHRHVCDRAVDPLHRARHPQRAGRGRRGGARHGRDEIAGALAGELPLALPEIMLGLNQTIMMALAMVVVAALVGAQGLGQEVMVALNQANSGKGLVSGLASPRWRS